MSLSGFLLLCLAFLPAAFLCMALLVKLTHSVLAPLRGGDPRVILWSALLPGGAASVVCALTGLWPMACDFALSALALALLGKRYVAPPPFRV